MQMRGGEEVPGKEKSDKQREWTYGKDLTMYGKQACLHPTKNHWIWAQKLP